MPIKTVGRESGPAQVHAEQSPNPDGNSARRDVAQLHVPRLLPYRHDNHDEYGQGDPAHGKDNQDQHSEHQFSAPLLMI